MSRQCDRHAEDEEEGREITNRSMREARQREGELLITNTNS